MNKSSKITFLIAITLCIGIRLTVYISNISQVYLSFSTYEVAVFSIFALLLISVIAVLFKANSLEVNRIKNISGFENEMNIMGYFGQFKVKLSMKPIAVNAIGAFLLFFLVPKISDVAETGFLSIYCISFIIGLIGCVFYLTLNLYELMHTRTEK